jgi:CheY-like chemotaxis protein
MKILLVDDSADMRKLVELFLKMLKHEVEVASNGQIAVDMVQSQDYDVILMDMRMPLMDGYEATAMIRKYEELQGKPKTPIVALTSFSMKEEIDKSLKAGCDCHLIKPVNRESLEEVLNKCTRPSSSEVSKVEEAFDEALYKVFIDEEIKDLVPAYIEKRHVDLKNMKQLLAEDDIEEIRNIGHKIKGSGGGYGFQGLTLIGGKIENAAKEKDKEAISSNLKQLETFLEKVEINYE